MRSANHGKNSQSVSSYQQGKWFNVILYHQKYFDAVAWMLHSMNNIEMTDENLIKYANVTHNKFCYLENFTHNLPGDWYLENYKDIL